MPVWLNAREHAFARDGGMPSALYRSFGEQEVSLKGDSPTRTCGMALEVKQDAPYLHWLIGVSAVGPNPRGVFSLVTDPGQGFFNCGSLDPLQRSKAVLEPGELTLPGDSIVLGGRTRFGSTIFKEGALAGFAINALAHDVAILWCALSQCAEARPLGCLQELFP